MCYMQVTVLLIVNNALQGILSSFFFKYADTILKKYSSTIATILTGLMSALFFGHRLTVNFCIGVTIVFISMHIFFSQGQSPTVWTCPPQRPLPPSLTDADTSYHTKAATSHQGKGWFFLMLAALHVCIHAFRRNDTSFLCCLALPTCADANKMYIVPAMVLESAFVYFQQAPDNHAGLCALPDHMAQKSSRHCMSIK